MKRLVSLLLFLWGCAWASGISAQGNSTVPTEVTQGAMSYVSGGTGEDEREALLARAADFDVKLVFAERGGAYLADVKLSISGQDGQPVLETVAAGPVFLARLPSGSYELKATYEGVTQVLRFSLSAHGRYKNVLRW